MTTSTPLAGDTGGVRRKPIPKRLRFEILARDKYTCRYCRATDAPLTIDHVVPTVLGGSDDPSNLVAACIDCNAGKSSVSPDAATVAQVDEDALRWAAAMRRATEIAEEAEQKLDAILLPFWEAWYSLVPGYKLGNPLWELPSNWREVVCGYLNSGLTVPILSDSARIALTTRGVDDRFRYFLGVCKRRLADLQEQAKRLIADGEV